MENVKTRLLKEIFNLTEEKGGSIDAITFRAQKGIHIAALNELEREGLIHKSNDNYRVNLIALNEINSTLSNNRIEFCEKFFLALKTFYKSNPRTGVTLKAFSNKYSLSEKEVMQTLPYFIDASCLSSWSGNFTHPDIVDFKPSEKVIMHESFGEIIEELSAPIKTEKIKNLYVGNGELVDENQIYPEWYGQLKDEIRDILCEVHIAAQHRLNSLAVMGLRATIDLICNDLIGDTGGFEQKLSELTKGGYITIRQKGVIGNIVEVGHASSHRGYVPDHGDVLKLLEITEAILKDIYVLEIISKKIKDKTPKRKQ